MATGFVGDFRRFFFRGLAAMLPALLTVMIIVWVLQFVDKYIGVYVNQFVQWIVVQWQAVAGRSRLSASAARTALWRELEKTSGTLTTST